ncbi:hypothetical protein KW807_02145 [Candidatus Parcubacteria bacterium]|nr:hypothetical protein [Candidatus Parcubacteria bacterium]
MNILNNETRTILMSAVFILIFGMFSSLLIARGASNSHGQEAFKGSWACTTDVEMCPDGTFVSRTPPYCQFAACP